ncbi:MAG: flagellar basal body L-ring protein FlgH [Gammaproteobacteria bacterium]|nr:flagellar basal body L-ring protein FlgH [Gammaproteobacteria bacterium]MDH5629584.1 flagellar basal body L-ring protein FlgH [Gammaproteobacteria bacterium]
MFKLLKKVFFISVFVLLAGCKTIYQNAQMDDPDWAPALPIVSNNNQANPGGIYNPNTVKLLFQDQKAHQVGDVITIVLTESTNATKTADTGLAKSSTTSLAAPSAMGNLLTVGGGTLDLSADSGAQDRSFSAETDSAQSNRLQGTISVTVHGVYPNGNLLVKGEKWIGLNQGNEFIRVAGIVRPEDVDKNNTVKSTMIANARISYGGTGPLAEANEEGWLTRFFNSGWWPF